MEDIKSPFGFFKNIGAGVHNLFGGVSSFWSSPLWHFALTILWILGIIGLIAGIYFVWETWKLHQEHHHKEHEEIEHRKQKKSKPHTHVAWENIINSLHGPSEAYWRLAIMDADSLLDAMLIDLGLQGVGVGDKLKQIDPNRMRTLNEAWEAHKIRNRIAHDGLNFAISQHEAQRVIYMFEQALREFGYI